MLTSLLAIKRIDAETLSQLTAQRQMLEILSKLPKKNPSIVKGIISDIWETVKDKGTGTVFDLLTAWLKDKLDIAG